MIIWINGAFGSGKTTTAYELHRRLAGSFVFDPENFGYFIRKNVPAEFSSGDFQDLPIWRETNCRLLKMLNADYGGVIIVPMTLVEPRYYAEIVMRLENDGVDVRRFIIYASREGILRRLKLRSLGFIRRERFAVNAIDRCVFSFDNYITETKIDTEKWALMKSSSRSPNGAASRSLVEKNAHRQFFLPSFCATETRQMTAVTGNLRKKITIRQMSKYRVCNTQNQ